MNYMSNRHIVKILFNVTFIFVLSFSVGLSTNLARAQSTQSATLFFSTPSTQVKEGDKITINVEVNSGGQSINAVSGTVSFPAQLVHVISINKDTSIVKLWTQQPKIRSSSILFEGIILNPGFNGKDGLVFSITFEAEAGGKVNLNFNNGAVLANNGLGTNVLATLSSSNFTIIPAPPIAIGVNETPTAQVAILPVITKYFPEVGPQENLYIGGKGEPFALTKISFQDLSVKSLGEKLVALFQNKKNTLGNVVVENGKNGTFHYISGSNLEAGAYSATPSLVDATKDTQTPGASVQFLVNDSVIVKDMVVLLNILGLLTPIILLIVIIYFIPWYSLKKMHLMKERMLLEEEKIELAEEELKQKSTTPKQ